MDLGAERALGKAAVGTGKHVFPPDELRKPHDALRHQLGMLDQVGRMGDNAGDEDRSFRRLDVLPHGPFMLMAYVRRFEKIGTGLDLEKKRLDVLDGDVGAMRSMPAAPAYMVADASTRNVCQRVVGCFDPCFTKFLKFP